MLAQQTRSEVPTLGQVFNEYIVARGLKPLTVQSYISVFRNHLAVWQDVPVTSITKSMVVARHREITVRGKSAADLAMRLLKSLLGWASIMYEQDDVPLIPINPVKRLQDLKAWNGSQPRSRRILQSQIKDWWAAVENLDHSCHTDYFKFLLLTGARRSEAAGITWQDVDFKLKTVTARNTKNGNDHTLPLSTYLFDMLLSRKEEQRVPWVFPAAFGVGPLVNPEESIIKVRQASGVDFALHDLRRTYLDACEDLDLRETIQKALLNHSLSDVTSVHYRGRVSVEKLREPMERITEHILKVAQANPNYGAPPLRLPPLPIESRRKQKIRMSIEQARSGMTLPAVSPEGV